MCVLNGGKFLYTPYSKFWEIKKLKHPVHIHDRVVNEKIPVSIKNTSGQTSRRWS